MAAFVLEQADHHGVDGATDDQMLFCLSGIPVPQVLHVTVNTVTDILEILELINDHCQLPGAGCVQQGLEQLREPHRNTEDGEIELSLICWRKSSQSAFSAIRLTNRYTKDFPSKAWRSNVVFPIRRLPVTMVNTACVCDYLFRSSKSPSS